MQIAIYTYHGKPWPYTTLVSMWNYKSYKKIQGHTIVNFHHSNGNKFKGKRKYTSCAAVGHYHHSSESNKVHRYIYRERLWKTLNIFTLYFFMRILKSTQIHVYTYIFTNLYIHLCVLSLFSLAFTQCKHTATSMCAALLVFLDLIWCLDFRTIIFNPFLPLSCHIYGSWLRLTLHAQSFWRALFPLAFIPPIYFVRDNCHLTFTSWQ